MFIGEKKKEGRTKYIMQTWKGKCQVYWLLVVVLFVVLVNIQRVDGISPNVHCKMDEKSYEYFIVSPGVQEEQGKQGKQGKKKKTIMSDLKASSRIWMSSDKATIFVQIDNATWREYHDGIYFAEFEYITPVVCPLLFDRSRTMWVSLCAVESRWERSLMQPKSPLAHFLLKGNFAGPHEVSRLYSVYME